MAIRPPRPPRRRTRPGNSRDVAFAVLTSTAILLFALRALMHLVGVRPWVTGWGVVSIPTNIIIGPMERVSFLQQHLINQLTMADMLALLVVSVGSMFMLASLANRRPA